MLAKKAALYLEIGTRYCSCTPESYIIDPKETASFVDENTILVCAILGSTHTGEYDDVQALNDELQKRNTTENLDVHIHIDAASGGFVVPFLRPELAWDFKLSSVVVFGRK